MMLPQKMNRKCNQGSGLIAYDYSLDIYDLVEMLC